MDLSIGMKDHNPIPVTDLDFTSSGMAFVRVVNRSHKISASTMTLAKEDEIAHNWHYINNLLDLIL